MTCARRGAGAHRPAASAPSRSPSSGPTPPGDRSRPDPRGGRARLSLVLPVLALLLGALGLFAAAPAQAQTTVWSATLTVPEGTQYAGCEASACAHGPDGGRVHLQGHHLHGERALPHTLGSLVWGAGVLASATKTALAGLTLKLGTGATATTLAIDSARALAANASLNWNKPAGLSWSSGDTVAVKLTAPASTSKPAKPTGLTATAGNGQVSLSWTSPNDATITKYQVQRRTGTTWGNWADIPNSAPGEANATSYTVTNLSNGTAYRFRIRAVNSAGNSPQSNATPAVTPQAPAGPAVTGALTVASSPPSSPGGWYKPTNAVKVEVTFDKAIVVTGAPKLAITVGSAAKSASCARKGSTGDGAKKLVCTYTVASGDEDTDGISVGANKLTLPSGASIKDASDAAATLTHAALGAQSGHKVDGVAPTVTIAAPSPSGAAQSKTLAVTIADSGAGVGTGANRWSSTTGSPGPPTDGVQLEFFRNLRPYNGKVSRVHRRHVHVRHARQRGCQRQVRVFGRFGTS